VNVTIWRTLAESSTAKIFVISSPSGTGALHGELNSTF